MLEKEKKSYLDPSISSLPHLQIEVIRNGALRKHLFGHDRTVQEAQAGPEMVTDRLTKIQWNQNPKPVVQICLPPASGCTGEAVYVVALMIYIDTSSITVKV